MHLDNVATGSSRPSLFRVVIGVPAGTVGGLLASLAITEGVLRGHGAEYLGSSGSWTFFVWADHYFLRIGASGVSAFLAGVVAGTVARQRGAIVGVLSGMPAMVVWAWLLVAAITGNFLLFPEATPPPGFMPTWNLAIPAAASIVTIPICAAQGGRFAVNKAAEHRVAELGWHLLYLAPIAVVSVTLTTIAAVPIVACIRRLLTSASTSPTDTYTTLLPQGTLDSWAATALLLPYLSAAGLPWTGLDHARKAILDRGMVRRGGNILVGALGGVAGSVAVMWLTWVVVSRLRQ